MHNPALSIITINYNNAKGLQKTIESVLVQSFKDLEFIIIDGGSTDGSVEVIKRFSDHIDYWVSEKDNGVYHAMNKGILKANGNYVLMLNSGDYLSEPGILEKIELPAHAEDLVYGNNIWVDATGAKRATYPETITYNFLKTGAVCHQSVFIKKELHNKAGLYSEDYKIASDWEFFLLAIARFNASQFYIDKEIAICDREGISCKPENWNLVVKERNDILFKHFNELFIEQLSNSKYQFAKKMKAEIVKRMKLLKPKRI